MGFLLWQASTAAVFGCLFSPLAFSLGSEISVNSCKIFDKCPGFPSHCVSLGYSPSVLETE